MGKGNYTTLDACGYCPPARAGSPTHPKWGQHSRGNSGEKKGESVIESKLE